MYLILNRLYIFFYFFKSLIEFTSLRTKKNLSDLINISYLGNICLLTCIDSFFTGYGFRYLELPPSGSQNIIYVNDLTRIIRIFPGNNLLI